jgi:hypothetical protein
MVMATTHVGRVGGHATTSEVSKCHIPLSVTMAKPMARESLEAAIDHI